LTGAQATRLQALPKRSKRFNYCKVLEIEAFFTSLARRFEAGRLRSSLTRIDVKLNRKNL